MADDDGRDGEQRNRGVGWSTTVACLLWQKRKSLDPFLKIMPTLGGEVRWSGAVPYCSAMETAPLGVKPNVSCRETEDFESFMVMFGCGWRHPCHDCESSQITILRFSCRTVCALRM